MYYCITQNIVDTRLATWIWPDILKCLKTRFKLASVAMLATRSEVCTDYSETWILAYPVADGSDYPIFFYQQFGSVGCARISNIVSIVSVQSPAIRPRANKEVVFFAGTQHRLRSTAVYPSKHIQKQWILALVNPFRLISTKTIHFDSTKCNGGRIIWRF